MLHRNQSFQSDKQSYNGESVKEINGMDIKMINFGENAELKAILNKFHDKDDTQEMNDKYVIIIFFLILLFYYEFLERNFEGNHR